MWYSHDTDLWEKTRALGGRLTRSLCGWISHLHALCTAKNPRRIVHTAGFLNGEQMLAGSVQRRRSICASCVAFGTAFSPARGPKAAAGLGDIPANGSFYGC